MGVIAAQHHLPPPARSCASLSARHVDRADGWTLELSGEADIATLTLLREELAAGARANRARFVIDVAALRFCDVVSAELIMSVSRTAPVSLTGEAGPVKRVFDLLDALNGPARTPAGPRAGRDHPDSAASGRRRREALPMTRQPAQATRPVRDPGRSGGATASTLAPVVETTLAPAVDEEPPIRRIPLRRRRIGGPQGPVQPRQ